MPLPLSITTDEFWDPAKNEFVYKITTIVLEHSLVSIQKWESKWHKPFLSKEPKTQEETIDYIRCMTITQNVDPRVYKCLTDEHMREVSDYIEDPMTATTISNQKGRPNREIVTAEIIYYWMTELNIPQEYRKWHLNQLLTLIQVCNIKKQPPKKMGKRATMRSNAALNAARRARTGSSG